MAARQRGVGEVSALWGRGAEVHAVKVRASEDNVIEGSVDRTSAGGRKAAGRGATRGGCGGRIEVSVGQKGPREIGLGEVDIAEEGALQRG